MNCVAIILLNCEGPETHSKSLRSKGKSISTWSHLGSFVSVSFDFSQVSSDKHILSNRSL